jgi:bifunctional ADP-heptose synthase (sugar kinase/adenylyltransferase)
VPGAPTIVKRRMVEVYPFQKLFEVYVMDDEVGEEVSDAVCARLEAVIGDYDAVIVTDYGHGMLSAGVIELLCSRSRFLAVNTQTNAANQGFNTISKYSRADYVCLSEREIRLEARSHRKDLRRIIPEVAEMLSCPRMLVTQGPQGCLCYEKGKELHRVPPFTNRIVDRVGAGDALFAVTSLCAARQAPVEIIGFLGNAVGAQAVEVVGNREVVSRAALWRQIESLVK